MPLKGLRVVYFMFPLQSFCNCLLLLMLSEYKKPPLDLDEEKWLSYPQNGLCRGANHSLEISQKFEENHVVFLRDPELI